VGLKLSILDRVSAWMHTSDRPLDFALLLELKPNAPNSDALLRGGESARHAFGQTGSRVFRDRWKWDPMDFFEVQDGVRDEQVALAMEAFLLKDFAPEAHNPVRQLLLSTDQQSFLLTRMHHAVGDGLSCLQWVEHQFAVALGQRPPTTDAVFVPPPSIEHHETALRKTPDAPKGASTRLWSSGIETTPHRQFYTLTLDAAAWRRRILAVDGLRYNDVLAGTLLETMAQWNRAHQDPTDALSLWFPINIRTEAFSGFGNGSSRVRIYRRDPLSLLEQCQSVREQLQWARQHGEWHVPNSAVFAWPYGVQRPLVRAILRRPWVDMGSMLFSHVERLGSEGDALMRCAHSLRFVGMLDKRFPAGFVGATHGDSTWMTLCWDSGLWNTDEAMEFLALYRQNLDLLAVELDG